MAEMALERGLLIHSSCIWRWVQIYGPELDKRGRAHLKRTNKSCRVDETYIRIKDGTDICTGPWIPQGTILVFTSAVIC
jgi:transposase-like protein